MGDWREISRKTGEEIAFEEEHVTNNDRETTEGSVGMLQQKVLKYLSKVEGHEYIHLDDIANDIDVDISTRDDLRAALEMNPKIIISSVDKNMFAYKATFSIKNKMELIESLKLSSEVEGLKLENIQDCYLGILDDIEELAHDGEIIVIKSSLQGKDDVCLYDRGLHFNTQLSAALTLEKGSNVVRTNKDVTKEIDRGEMIILKDIPFRISFNGGPTSFIGKWGFPYSITSDVRQPLQHRDGRGFTDKFDSTTIILDRIWTGESINNVMAMKEGCTNDIKKLWCDVVDDDKGVLNFPKNRVQLDSELLKNKLIDQKVINQRKHMELEKLKLINAQEDKEKKIRKKRKLNPSKQTNSHLIGTELGRNMGFE